MDTIDEGIAGSERGAGADRDSGGPERFEADLHYGRGYEGRGDLSQRGCGGELEASERRSSHRRTRTGSDGNLSGAGQSGRDLRGEYDDVEIDGRREIICRVQGCAGGRRLSEDLDQHGASANYGALERSGRGHQRE